MSGRVGGNLTFLKSVSFAFVIWFNYLFFYLIGLWPETGQLQRETHKVKEKEKKKVVKKKSSKFF